jgi:hypothetical protein
MTNQQKKKRKNKLKKGYKKKKERKTEYVRDDRKLMTKKTVDKIRLDCGRWVRNDVKL